MLRHKKRDFIIVFSKILESGEFSYFQYVSFIVQLFIITSISVSFMTMGSALHHTSKSLWNLSKEQIYYLFPSSQRCCRFILESNIRSRNELKKIWKYFRIYHCTKVRKNHSMNFLCLSYYASFFLKELLSGLHRCWFFLSSLVLLWAILRYDIEGDKCCLDFLFFTRTGFQIDSWASSKSISKCRGWIIPQYNDLQSFSTRI